VCSSSSTLGPCNQQHVGWEARHVAYQELCLGAAGTEEFKNKTIDREMYTQLLMDRIV
jgi:hypothetical protein